MSIDEMIAVLQAAKDGKGIECLHKEKRHIGWYPCIPIWNFEKYDYRVAPEPREFWVPEHGVPLWKAGEDFGNYGFDIYYAKSQAGCLAHWPNHKPILFREVLEDE